MSHRESLISLVLAAIMAPVCLGFEPSDITGLWNFRRGDLSATIGEDMEFGQIWTQQNTTFLTTDGVTVPHINGIPAKVMHVPRRQEGLQPWEHSHYLVPHGVPVPNGGASQFAAEYSIAMDVLITDVAWSGGITGSGVHQSWVEINIVEDPNTSEYWLQTGGSGVYMTVAGADPSLRPDTWYRLVFVYDAGNELRVYKNGTLVSTYDDSASAGNIDGSWLTTGSRLMIARQLSDGYINSVATFNKLLTDAEAASLGGPNADGIIIPAACGDPGTEYLPTDVTGPSGVPDCVVDAYDLAEFMSAWLLCSDPNNPDCDPFWKLAQ